MLGDNEYEKVLKRIDKLQSMVPDSLFSFENPNWKSIWEQIRIVGASFKGVKFPTHAN